MFPFTRLSTAMSDIGVRFAPFVVSKYSAQVIILCVYVNVEH